MNRESIMDLEFAVSHILSYLDDSKNSKNNKDIIKAGRWALGVLQYQLGKSDYNFTNYSPLQIFQINTIEVTL